jgi:TatD DNase family protein
MLTGLYDAHVHLAAPALHAEFEDILEAYSKIDLRRAVVVGTSPGDWPGVIELAASDERFIPAIGLHPWQVNHASGDWRKDFDSCLNRDVAVVGEIGLDQWIKDHDIEAQQEAFEWQLSIAAERNLPTSIHCLKAHEPMLQSLRSTKLPERGFKMHAYNGPATTLKPLLELGAHFSFNAGQLKPNAKRVRELIRAVPADRLLVETDAPDFLPPNELREFRLEASDLCHPANLRIGYRAIAEVRGCGEEELIQVARDNFVRYFFS